MSKRKYWKYEPRNFSNEYDLLVTIDKEEETEIKENFKNCSNNGARFERVTVKEVRQLAREERERRKYDTNFSGYCDLIPWNVYKRGSVAIAKFHALQESYTDYIFRRF